MENNITKEPQKRGRPRRRNASHSEPVERISRGRPNNDKPPKEPKQGGRPNIFIKQPKDLRKDVAGHKLISPPKHHRKGEGHQSLKLNRLNEGQEAGRVYIS